MQQNGFFASGLVNLTCLHGKQTNPLTKGICSHPLLSIATHPTYSKESLKYKLAPEPDAMAFTWLSKECGIHDL